MKLILSQAPFTRITIPLILGIIFTVFISYFAVNIIIIPAVLIVLALLSNLLLNKRINSKDIVFNLLITAIFFTLGYGVTSYKISKLKSFTGKGIFLIQTTQSPQIKGNNIKFTAKLISKKDSSGFVKLNNQKIILYLKNDSNYTVPDYGDFLIVKANINEIESPKNPSQFNYKRYLFYNGVLSGGFVKQNDWKLIKNSEYNIYKLANNIRNFLLLKLNNFDISNKNKAIISAISLGKREDIDSLTNTQFSNAGVMHILAVSGLHVGIVFLILITAFKPLMRFKGGKYFIYFSIIIILWFYAIITGFTPSVVRAVLMFSLVSLGKAFSKKHNIYNTIFASAFILLIINPFYIFQVGFQLSYLAVIGIIFFQPKISSLIKTNNRIYKYLWDIISVSLAAQLATLPITLLYFHKFPVYFLLSNIAVMLNVTLILVISFVFFATYYIPYINEFVAKVLDYSASTLNFSIEKINKLPYPIIDNISWSISSTLLLYAIIIVFAFYILYRNKYIFTLFTVLIFILFSFTNYKYYKNYKNEELSFFSVNKHTIIGFSSKDQTTLLFDRNYKNLRKDIKFNISNYLINNGCNNTKTGLIKYRKTDKKLKLYRRNNFIKIIPVCSFDQKLKTIFIYNGEKILDTTNIINLDYLIIQKYNYWNFDNVLKKFKPNNIILSTTLWTNNIAELDSVLSKNKPYNVINLNTKSHILAVK